MKYVCLAILLFSSTFATAQPDIDKEIERHQGRLLSMKEEQKDIYNQLEELKFKRIRRDLKSVGLPIKAGEELVEHSAMCMVYSEEHEQAKWVAHVIIPDVNEGRVTRSNDFRPDANIKTGSAVEADYFVMKMMPDSSLVYDGFGYDRGHLAPSADFRWSLKALSESYYYSNMSPQVADFNRGKWAELEDMVRSYVYYHPKSQVFVVSGPILTADLPVIERGVNKVSIPKLYFKVALDLERKKAIGFIMPNQLIKYPIESFATTIDKIEEETGLDFFANLPDDLENELEKLDNVESWMPPKNVDNVEPIYPPDLPRYHFNTVQSKLYAGKNKEINVCGKVVSTRTTKKGNIMLNLDKKFPNTLFTIIINKENIINFAYNPEKELLGKTICSFGTVIDFNGTPAMSLKNDNAISYFDELETD